MAGIRRFIGGIFLAVFSQLSSFYFFLIVSMAAQLICFYSLISYKFIFLKTHMLNRS